MFETVIAFDFERVVFCLKLEQQADIIASFQASENQLMQMDERSKRILKWRLKVCGVMLYNAIPFSKLDDNNHKYSLRSLIEEGCDPVGSGNHLKELIPSLMKVEIDSVLKEIDTKLLSVVFDASCKFAECFGVVIRFVDNDYNIQQRLVAFDLLAEPLTGSGICAQLVDVIIKRLSVDPNRMIAFIHDRARSNVLVNFTILLFGRML